MTSEVSYGRDTVSPSDDVLIAEIAPDMLAKLKSDSRQQRIWLGAVVMLGGTGQFGKSAFGTPIDTILAIFGVALSIFGLVTLYKAYYGAPVALQLELAYRPKQGKWRWDH